MGILTSPALRYNKSLWSYNPLPTGCALYLPLWAIGVSANPPTLFSNGSFESGDPPTGITASAATISSEGTIVKVGSKSLKILNNDGAGAGNSYATKVITDTSHLQGKKATLGCWYYCPSANDRQQRIDFGDDTGTTVGTVLTKDDAWHWFTLTRTIGGAATELRFFFKSSITAIIDTDDILYIDGAIVVEGDGSDLVEEPHPTMSFKSVDPFGHTCTNNGANKRAVGHLQWRR